MNRCVNWAAAVVSVALAGCATRPMKGAFEELTYEGSRATTRFASYHSLLSISGLIPPHTPGGYVLEADGALSGKSAPSLLSGVSSRCSYVVHSTFPSGTMEKVTEIKLAYLDLREKSLGVATALAHLSRTRKVRQTVGAKEVTSVQAAIEATKAPNEVASSAESEAFDALAKARSALSVASTSMANKLAPNYLVTTWASDENQSASGGINGDNRGSASMQRQRKGLLVMGGLRIRALVIGKDYKHMLDEFTGSENGTFVASVKMSSIGIVTLVIEAQHVAYISEMDYLQEMAVAMNLTKESLIEGLTDDAKIEIAAAMTAADAVSNTASFSGPEIVSYPFNFKIGEHHNALLGELNRSSGYIQTYVVRGNLNFTGISLMSTVDGTPPECESNYSIKR